MEAMAPGPAATGTPAKAALPPHRRNAQDTRQLLLEVARQRFARNGYAATTVREITDEAGVNVALISRYFSSKEGLFEACLASAVDDLGPAVGGDADLGDVAAIIAGRLAGPQSGEHIHKMVLLLRTSGDGRAEDIRLGMLDGFARGLQDLGRPADADPDQARLRSQIALAAVLGVALIRSSTPLQPLAGATESDLAGPLQDVLEALLA